MLSFFKLRKVLLLSVALIAFLQTILRPKSYKPPLAKLQTTFLFKKIFLYLFWIHSHRPEPLEHSSPTNKLTYFLIETLMCSFHQRLISQNINTSRCKLLLLVCAGSVLNAIKYLQNLFKTYAYVCNVLKSKNDVAHSNGCMPANAGKTKISI